MHCNNASAEFRSFELRIGRKLIDRCAFRKSYPDVMVVQPRQDWDRYNDPGPLDCPT
jgi:hypothetical protein